MFPTFLKSSRMFHKLKYLISTLLLVAMLQGCATYYDKAKKIESALLVHDYTKAKKSIKHNKFLKKKRNTLLYHLEMGKVYHLENDFDTSNYHFNMADDLMEESGAITDFLVSTAVNPNMQTYRASSNEKIIIHYYKALNYLQLGNMDDAVVEARKLNLKEQALFIDKKGKDKKYAQDPFGLLLMGMIYEADKDFNNAFITYRNAYEYYQKSKVFKGKMPATLVSDVNRTARISGINYFIGSDIRVSTKGEGGELILFWENGLAPIKREKNVYFTLLQGDKKGMYFFSDQNNTMQIPITYDFSNRDKEFKPSDIGLLRIASSYFESRPMYNHQASLRVNDKSYYFNLGEDIEQLAYQMEKEDYLIELGKRFTRMVVKKVAELALSNQNEAAGLALGIANFAMEKADTRSWQTLPNQIYYARIPLKKGQNIVEVTLENGKKISLDVLAKGGMQFKSVVTY